MMGKLRSLNHIPLLSLSLFIFFNVFIPISCVDVCSLVNCGQGVCRAIGLFGFQCQCNRGWSKPQIEEYVWPTCVFPNCSADLNCGSSPAPVAAAPVPPFAPPQLLDVFKPCGFVWCGWGKCVVKPDVGYTCQCDEGYANLLRTASLPCFRECHFGANCNGINFSLPLLPP